MIYTECWSWYQIWRWRTSKKHLHGRQREQVESDKWQFKFYSCYSLQPSEICIFEVLRVFFDKQFLGRSFYHKRREHRWLYSWYKETCSFENFISSKGSNQISQESEKNASGYATHLFRRVEVWPCPCLSLSILSLLRIFSLSSLLSWTLDFCLLALLFLSALFWYFLILYFLLRHGLFKYTRPLLFLDFIYLLLIWIWFLLAFLFAFFVL